MALLLQQNQPKKTSKKLVFLYFLLLFLFWLAVSFILIPLYDSNNLPADSYELIEGERAYMAIARAERPKLVEVLRGLNMVNAQFSQEKLEDSRLVKVGNINLIFGLNGEFLSITSKQ